MTVDPPDVQPSLGDIALMHGVATGKGGQRPAVNVKGEMSNSLLELNDTSSIAIRCQVILYFQ